MPINLANKKHRDTTVSISAVKAKDTKKNIDETGLDVEKVRLLKSSIEHGTEYLTERFGDLEALGEHLLNEDPEIDFEKFGRFLKETSRVYFADGKIVFHVTEVEKVFAPDGSEKETKQKDIQIQNVNTDIPISWSNKFFKKDDAIRRFVFTSSKQISHTNGLTFDFLFEMAKELDEKDSLMMVGGGKKGNEPLVFQRGGKKYRGFLEGRIKESGYVLLLHLSNMELKRPQA